MAPQAPLLFGVVHLWCRAATGLDLHLRYAIALRDFEVIVGVKIDILA